jgi:hypothetical protein
MPANIALAIDSDKSLLVTFDAPPSDFGSQVSSYKVEWDSNPGAREEQVVTCTVATGPNEVQKLTTSASRVPEVQVVSITATSAAAGFRITGNFTLGFGGQVTVPLPRDATEDEVCVFACARVCGGRCVCFLFYEKVETLEARNAAWLPHHLSHTVNLGQVPPPPPPPPPPLFPPAPGPATLTSLLVSV